ncbi:hypothetical protein Y032_0608g594 [Ancylostoma ceylanicum]|uniref:Uncharacterized protein n=1 Tax=Ancylostoma ceylanicum TaxID=53326 RepID=A0A016WND1_9BILA|nr:hypothetical protein Y032_0608g594 [Ancylostoma ceylanicum]
MQLSTKWNMENNHRKNTVTSTSCNFIEAVLESSVTISTPINLCANRVTGAFENIDTRTGSHSAARKPGRSGPSTILSWGRSEDEAPIENPGFYEAPLESNRNGSYHEKFTNKLDYRKTRCEVVHMERTMSSGFAIGQFRELTDRKSLLSRNTNDHRRRSRLQHVAR